MTGRACAREVRDVLRTLRMDGMLLMHAPTTSFHLTDERSGVISAVFYSPERSQLVCCTMISCEMIDP